MKKLQSFKLKMSSSTRNVILILNESIWNIRSISLSVYELWTWEYQTSKILSYDHIWSYVVSYVFVNDWVVI